MVYPHLPDDAAPPMVPPATDASPRSHGIPRGREALLSSIVASAMDAVITVDARQRIVLFNAAAEQIFRIPAAEAIGQRIERFIPEPYRSAHARKVRAFGRTDKTMRSVHTPAEVTALRSDGQPFPVEATIARSEVDGQQLFTVILRDVSAREQAREALRRSEQRFRALVQHGSDMLSVTDTDGKTTYISPSVTRILGYPPEELIGRSTLDIVHAEDVGRVAAAVDAAMNSTGGHEPFEVRVRHRNGSWRFIEAVVTDMSGDSSVAGLVVNSRDVTDRRRAEAETRLLQSVTFAVSESDDVTSAFAVVLRNVCEATGWDLGQVWLPNHDGSLLECSPAWYGTGTLIETFRAATAGVAFAPGDGLPGRVWATRQPIWVPDVARVRRAPRRSAAKAAGIRAVAAIPLLVGDDIFAVLEFFLSRPREEDKHVVNLVTAVAAHVGSVLERKQAEEALRASEERFRVLVEGMHDYAVLMLDSDGNVISWNVGAERIKNYTAEAIIGRHFSCFYPDDQVAAGRPLQALAAAVAGGRHEDEGWRLRRDGTRFWANVVITALWDDTGQLRGFSNVTRDITERRHAEESLRYSEERFRSLVQNASDIITILDADGIVRYHSPSVERVLGYSIEHALGGSFLIPIHREDAARVQSFFEEVARNPGVSPSIQFRTRHRNGSWRHFEALANNLLDDPSVQGIIVNSRDITERKGFEDQLMELAFHDVLTGLPNRGLFRDRLAHALARAARRAQTVAVLFLDLDRFKVVNDSLGHAAGDELLVGVGQRLSACVRPGDTVARFGGDEFAVLVEDVAHPGDATRVAERIIESLRRPVILGGREVFVSASVGVAFTSINRSEPADLLRDADVALYHAKVGGRSRAVVFDTSMNARAVERLEIETDLRRAVERGELMLYYQPEVDLGTSVVVGMEALARWQHPRLGLIAPQEFIPLAEETGLILPIGRWVLEEACRQARAWSEFRRPDGSGLVVSVNLSPRQFQQPDLVEQVADIVRASGLDPRLLKLEITESTAMQDGENTIAILHALRGLGVQLAIDDFGTGYSSLSYLQRFAVDTLKVDRSFVSSLHREKGAVAIVQAVTALAHALGMDVTAEGIETAEHLASAWAIHCDRGQGYFFSRPLPAEVVHLALQSGLTGIFGG